MFILGFKQLQDPYYQGFAAQIAFYLLLSMVPIVLLITQILGAVSYTHLTLPTTERV